MRDAIARLWLRLHGLEVVKGRFVQGEVEIIPDYAVVTWLLIELIGIVGVVLALAVWWLHEH